MLIALPLWFGDLECKIYLSILLKLDRVHVSAAVIIIQ